MKVPSFKQFVGQHCETTATGSLLQHLGIRLSEPMLFGLGEGLGFIYWKMKSMEFPFIGGRIKTHQITRNICRNLNLNLAVRESSSLRKAWEHVSGPITDGNPVGLKLDCYHLDYFTAKIHFAGHYVAMYGFDEEFAYLVDTEQQGGMVKTRLENLALARSEKGPMASRNLSFTISADGETAKPRDVVARAVLNNARDYLSPAISNMTYKGILKTSKELRKWFETTPDRKRDFQTTAMLMEKAGTGGSLFRNLFRDFLIEASDLTSNKVLENASKQFESIAKKWKSVAELLHEAGETGDVRHIESASSILVDLSESERAAMRLIMDVAAA
ncbi:MAG: BtrH N-terminal domain-containing protein [Pyrinomonadaceae bacterium]